VPAHTGHSVQSSGFGRQKILPPQGIPVLLGSAHMTVLSTEPVYGRPHRMHPASGRGFLGMLCVISFVIG